MMAGFNAPKAFLVLSFHYSSMPKSSSNTEALSAHHIICLPSKDCVMSLSCYFSVTSCNLPNPCRKNM